MKNNRKVALGCIVCIFFLQVPGLAQDPELKPNVIVILTDDQGTLDLNCYGSKDLITPHMDALAASGTRFTQFYAAAPVCSPSRAGLLTGMSPLRAGLPGNVPIPEKEKDAGLSTNSITMAEMMKAGGYKTAHIGKWHLGHGEEKQPNAQGFDYSFGHLVGCIDNYSHFFYWSGPNKHDLWRNGKEVFYDGEYFPDLTVQEVNQFMETNREDPFFIYWAINVPHYPYQGHEKWLKKYQDLESPRREYAWMPTIAEICQVNLPKENLEGKSLVSVIRENDPTPHQVIHWQIGESGDSNSSWAVRSGDWKLLGNPRDPNTTSISEADSLFLANLQLDVSEQENLAPKYPGEVARLKKLHEEWVRDIGSDQ